MEEEEIIDDISETQYMLYEHVATESEFDELSKSWDESDETDNKRKPENQMNQQPAKKQCNLWRSWEQCGSGVRGRKQVRGEQVRGEQVRGEQVRGEQVRGEQEKKRKPENQMNQQPAKKCSCLLYTSPSPRDMRRSRMPSSA